MPPPPTRVHGYGWIAPIYEGLADAYTGGACRAVKRRQAVHLEPGTRVLYAGVGAGSEALLGARRGVRPVLLDASAAMLGRARRRLRREGFDATWVCADLRDVDFEPHFEAVVANFLFNVFRHDEVGLLLARLARALAPNGVLHVADFAAPAGRSPRHVLRWPAELYHAVPMAVFRLVTGNAWHRIHDLATAGSAAGLRLLARDAVPLFGVGPRWIERLELQRCAGC